MPRLFVVRHGQASIHKANYDELSARGRQQATALGAHWGQLGIGFSHAFCGPAQRHLDTAALARQACLGAGGSGWPEATVLPTLDEHDAFGLVSRAVSRHSDDPAIARGQRALSSASTPAERSAGFQRLFEAVMRRWLRGEVEVPEVESWPVFRGRVVAALDTMTEAIGRGQQGVAFSSVGPLAVLLLQALGTDPESAFVTAWRIRNASITRFVFDGAGRLTLDGFNAMPHLPDASTWTFR